MIIFSGTSNLSFTAKLAKKLKATVGDVDISTFPNDEKRIRLQTSVDNKEVVLLQSLSAPVDSHLIELVLMADACERAGAKNVTAVIPWLGYSLQDKVFRDGEALAARVVADIVSNAFIQRVILLDMHNPSIIGFFSVPTLHIRALSLFTDYVKANFDMSKTIVVSPDFGGLKASRAFSESLGAELVNVNKHRNLNTGEVSTVGLAGDVDGKICLVYDDVINTGGTVVEVAKLLKEQGAKEVHFFVSHGLFAGEGLQKMEEEAIDSVVITDSVYHQDLPAKIKVLSVVDLIAKKLE